MPRQTVDVHTPYLSMAPVIPLASLPPGKCQYASGFLPSRHGKMELAPLLKRIQQPLLPNYSGTDLAATAATSTPVISSATHNFTSLDVGKFITITAGTNWTPGVYKIVSVLTNTATLDRACGSSATLSSGTWSLPPDPIHGTAIWFSSDGQLDKLLIFSAYKVFTTPLFNVWNYDERMDGQHGHYIIGTLTDLGVTLGASAALGINSVQFETELIVSVGGILSRFYVDEPAGTQHWFPLGLATPAAPSPVSSGAGNLTVGQTYSWLQTTVDGKGRESSPSSSASLLIPPGGGAVNVTRGTVQTSGTDAVSWNLYRKNPGSVTFNFVATVAIGTTVYNDNNTDAVVQAGASAPTSGENDAPNGADILEIWNNRLILNDTTDPAGIQVSNADSPTQFSSLNLPTNIADGLRATVIGHGDNQVTGLGSLGSLLAIFKRQTTHFLYGDNSSNFTLRGVHERGCQNHASVRRCENEVLFLSDDGVYAIGYESGYSVTKISGDLDDLFRGFTPTAQAGEPTATGRLSSIQVVSGIKGNVSSFYDRGRYYLSIGNRTLVCDVQNGYGWTDTGWGFVKTASVYFSQFAYQAGSAPSSVFLTIGDVNAFASALDYFTAADTPQDVDAPVFVAARIQMRPVDNNNAPQVRLKEMKRLSLYGTTAARKGQQIGTLSWYAGNRRIKTMKLYAWMTRVRRDALIEIEPPHYTAEVPWCDLQITQNDVVLGNAIFEYRYVN